MMTANSSFDADAHPELRELIALACSGLATADQHRRLEQLLSEVPQAVDYYVAHVLLQSHLSDLLADTPASKELQLPGQAALRDHESRRGSRPRLVSKLWRPGLVSMIAAGLLLAGLIAPPLLRQPTAVALLISEAAPDSERPLRAGEVYRQASGTSSIVFSNGVRMSVYGDSEVEIVSGLKVILHRGQIDADVGEAGRGFTVLTSSAEVVDLGTVFGVEVRSGGTTDVVVFDGAVDVDRREPVRRTGAVAEHSLATGEALRVDQKGEFVRIPLVWKDTTARGWSTGERAAFPTLIASVSDNLTSQSRPKYYSIVPEGFRPGVKCYVDRPYEWRDDAEFPFPTELIGGDLIQPFNNDRVRTDLEVVLELSAPAWVYVLFDERTAPPEWLTDSFERTDRQILQWADVGDFFRRRDERIARRTDPEAVIPASRYQFTDRYPFQLWRRLSTSPEPLRLGPSYEADSESHGMYGIVVVGQQQQ